MAFDADPEIYFPGIFFDSAGMNIPNDILDTYDETDSRTIIFSLVKRLYDVYVSTSGVDRPQNMVITKVNTPISVENDSYRQSFSFSFNVSYSGDSYVIGESG